MHINGRIAALRRMREELAPVVGWATNGESAGNTLRQTLGGAVLPWQDVLHAGPVPAVPRRELLRLRAAFLARAGRGSRRGILGSLELRDAQLLRAFGERIDVVLWFEHDLYDQLQLLDVLALAHEAGVEPELVVVGSFPGKPSFRGLGELAGDELATLWPDRRRADTQSLATAASGGAGARRRGGPRRAPRNRPLGRRDARDPCEPVEVVRKRTCVRLDSGDGASRPAAVR